MEPINLSFALEASSQTIHKPKGKRSSNTTSLDTLAALDFYRTEWDRHRGELLGAGLARLDGLDIPTRRRNNLQALYRVLLTLPLEDIRHSKHHGICLFHGGYERLSVAGIGGCRGPVKQRLSDLVALGLIASPKNDNPQDRFSQLVIPLPSLPLCLLPPRAGIVNLKQPTKRPRKKIEKPIHYLQTKTVYRLSNFFGYATLLALAATPGMKAREIAEVRGVNVHAVWADLRSAKALELVFKKGTRYYTTSKAKMLREEELLELDTSESARMDALSGLHRAEAFYIRTLSETDLPLKTRSSRTRALILARQKIDRIYDGEATSIIYGLRRKA